MIRGSDKHSPMVDEALKHDTASMAGGTPAESRAQEGREQEGPGDGEPTPDTRIQGERPGRTPSALSPDELNDRADLARFLEPSVFPAERPALVANARSNYAPDDIVASLERLPDLIYGNVQEVWAALGGRTEPARNAGRHFTDPPDPGMSSGEGG